MKRICHKRIANGVVVNGKIIQTNKIKNKIEDNIKIDKKIENNSENNNLIYYDYYNRIDEFINIYQNIKQEIIDNNKIGFRYFCFKFLNYIRQINLPKIELNKYYEAVLIEFHCVPHIEFLIRNNILKLGSNWSYTIICGNLNYNFIKNICENISSNIKIIKINYDNLEQNDYNKLLSSIEFWNLFTGDKILIYQNETCILKSNIHDFLSYDYIGNNNFYLITKKIIIDILNNNTDIVLSKESLLKYDNINLSSDEISYKFLLENDIYKNNLAIYNFIILNNSWKKILYDNIIIQFKPTYDISMLEHRGGWKSVINNLSNKDFFNEYSEYIFFDMIEKYFLWKTDYYCHKKWIGIIHCTQNTPPYLNNLNITYLFDNINFIKSLDNCICIISLSQYTTNFLNIKINNLNKKINIFTLKHPVDTTNIIMFNYEKYINNNNKYLIQIGQQLRKITSIYILNLPSNYKKLWLTGTRNINHLKILFANELNLLNRNRNIKINDIETRYIESYYDYDLLLSNNIIFIDLFDASANNALLEAIIRNTPIIINKLSAVVEYLGENYPLYYNDLSEINNLLNNKKIYEAQKYLENMNKEDLTMEYFTKQLYTNIYMNIFNNNLFM
jgi:hypothetical protein